MTLETALDELYSKSSRLAALYQSVRSGDYLPENLLQVHEILATRSQTEEHLHPSPSSPFSENRPQAWFHTLLTLLERPSQSVLLLLTDISFIRDACASQADLETEIASLETIIKGDDSLTQRATFAHEWLTELKQEIRRTTSADADRTVLQALQQAISEAEQFLSGITTLPNASATDQTLVTLADKVITKARPAKAS